MQERILAKALRPGDTIGIVSPSWFGGEAFLPRANRGIRALRSLGFEVRVGDHAFENAGWVSASVERRVLDLHAMFSDPTIRAIFCTIGGDHACHLLPHLDWDLMRANPKVFLGFSDISVLNIAIWARTGLVTFNGPTLLTDWAEYPAMPEISREAALRAVTVPQPIGGVPSAFDWTEEFLDWTNGEDETRPRQTRRSEGWRWLRGGCVEGPLVVGCLESLQHLRGTPYWPDLRGAILLLETSEEAPSPAEVDALLMDMENMGTFGQISGLIWARPYGYSDGDRESLFAVLCERTDAYRFPILADVDCGHTTPLVTLPIGCRARLDSTIGEFSILEPAVMP
ncbi:MAG TPA: S66 peptidase family protein [Thermomicrobiales bacterium]|nr:S66 peptidase family protein [Thermomicrobiales bacterium]